MASHSCVSGCGRFLASSDGHDRCPSCLGYQQAEAALMDESCSHCGNMTIAMLRSGYLLGKRWDIPLALPCSSSSGFWRATSAHGQGDLRIIVRASPSSTSPWASHSSSASHQQVLFGGELLAQSDLVPRTDAPRDSPSLAKSSEEGSPFSERGDPLAPASRLVESPRMVCLPPPSKCMSPLLPHITMQ